MKKAFTMIELIFVIVIIGILAAIAIPKLMVTRDDAEIAKAVTDLAVCIENAGAYTTSKLSPTANDVLNISLCKRVNDDAIFKVTFDADTKILHIEDGSSAVSWASIAHSRAQHLYGDHTFGGNNID
jgi:prepilin-type N-terminal cleavage/methylation domain-containing protein